MSKNNLVNIVTIRVIYVIHLFFFKLLHTMNITKNDIVSAIWIGNSEIFNPST